MTNRPTRRIFNVRNWTTDDQWEFGFKDEAFYRAGYPEDAKERREWIAEFTERFGVEVPIPAFMLGQASA